MKKEPKAKATSNVGLVDTHLRQEEKGKCCKN